MGSHARRYTTNMAKRDVLAVHTAGVIASAKDIDQVNTEIKEAFLRLKSEGQEVIGGSWTGSAATKLDEGWQQWQEGIHTLTRALEEAVAYTIKSAETFKRT